LKDHLNKDIGGLNLHTGNQNTGKIGDDKRKIQLTQDQKEAARSVGMTEEEYLVYAYWDWVNFAGFTEFKHSKGNWNNEHSGRASCNDDGEYTTSDFRRADTRSLEETI
jgi:hypothetical protein